MRKFIEALDTGINLEDARTASFEALADAQRGEPEIAMVRAQHTLGGGVLNYCIEHVGDLTHRMCEHPTFIPYCGYQTVKPKVTRSYSMLSSTYRNPQTSEMGFYAEFMQNMRNNAVYYYPNLPSEEAFAQQMESAKKSLSKYADAHRKLKVYNKAQHFAREAAVALGEMDFDRAREYLSYLDSWLTTPEEWKRHASKFDPNFGALSEAPIADLSTMGPLPRAKDEPTPTERLPFEKGFGFGAVDRKLIQSKKGIEKIIRAFQKTPHIFEVFLINSMHIDGDYEDDNEGVDWRASELKAGVHDSYEGITGKAGTIRVIMLGNLSPVENKMPFSAWTLAHKIGHSLQDDCYNRRWKTPTAKHVKKMLKALNNLAAEVHQHAGNAPVEIHSTYFAMHPHLNQMLTMKSARDNRDLSGVNDFDIFAEVIAQYLITGRVKMLVPDEFQSRVGGINAMIKAMFDSLNGKVLVEL